MKLLKRAVLAVATTIVVTVGAAAWTTRPVSAQEMANDSYSAWCARIHHELFSALPAEVQQKLMDLHGSHAH